MVTDQYLFFVGKALSVDPNSFEMVGKHDRGLSEWAIAGKATSSISFSFLGSSPVGDDDL